MSKRALHRPQAFQRPDAMQWDAPSTAIERWAVTSQAPQSAIGEQDDSATISIYEMIGEDYWSGDGFTAKKMGGILRAIGERDITVRLNSPGGDMFEGLAIYNQLAEHKGAVTIKVMGLAASAASIIAMAGDEIRMGLGSFLMIHNCWGVVIGNQADLREAAGLFATFDGAMADIYAHRTGGERDAIAAMMNGETWLSANEAIAAGFATGTLDDEPEPDTTTSARADLSARRRLEALLARQGVPRSERRKLLREAAGTPDAAGFDTPCAVFDPALVAEFTRILRY
jgi:ATP-dependent Clp protease, protease subunit